MAMVSGKGAPIAFPRTADEGKAVENEIIVVYISGRPQSDDVGMGWSGLFS